MEKEDRRAGKQTRSGIFRIFAEIVALAVEAMAENNARPRKGWNV